MKRNLCLGQMSWTTLFFHSHRSLLLFYHSTMQAHYSHTGLYKHCPLTTVELLFSNELAISPCVFISVFFYFYFTLICSDSWKLYLTSYFQDQFAMGRHWSIRNKPLLVGELYLLLLHSFLCRNSLLYDVAALHDYITCLCLVMLREAGIRSNFYHYCCLALSVSLRSSTIFFSIQINSCFEMHVSSLTGKLTYAICLL